MRHALYGCVMLMVFHMSAIAADVTFLSWQQSEPVLEELFPQHRPDINVEYHAFAGQPRLIEQIYLRAAANVNMDVILTHTNWFQELIDQDLLLDLRPFIERDQFDLSVFPSAVIQSFTGPQGEIYALPFQWTTIVLAYNADILDKFAVQHPTEDWDIFDMEEAAKKLSVLSGDGLPRQWGLSTQSLREYVWRLWGVPFLNEARNGSGWHDPRAVEAWDWYQEIMSEPLYNGSFDHFANGQLALKLAWPNHMMRYGPENDRWDVAVHPKGPAGRVSRAAGAQWVIYRNSKNPEAAWEVLKFLSTYETQLEYLVRGLGGVHVPAMLQYWVYDFDRGLSGVTNPEALKNTAVIPEAYSYASLEPRPASYNDILREIVVPMAASLERESAPAQSVVPEAARQIDVWLQAMD